MKLKIFIFFSPFLVLTYCSKPKDKSPQELRHSLNTPPYIIDLGNNLNNEDNIPISNIGKGLEYIPLETTNKCLLKGIQKIELSDAFIFVSDFNKLVQFDRKGNFIRQIGSKGKGPGEYIYVSDFCIDRIKDKIYIIAWGTKTVLEFDFNGRFIRSFKYNFPSQQFLVWDTCDFVFYLPNIITKNNSDSSLNITDNKGIPFRSYKKAIKRTNHPGISIVQTSLYYYNESLRFLEFGADTMHTVSMKKLDPYAIFDLKEKKMDVDIKIPLEESLIENLNRQLKGKFWIGKVLEDKNFFYISLISGLKGPEKYCLFNKETLETRCLTENGFKDDIDGGVNFWPTIVYCDSILVDWCNPDELINAISNEDSDQKKETYGDRVKLRKQLSALNESSNPVLILLNSK